MSDTDDGFDREAAREELREKYEDEREDREATARMSELLLQGATMTNEHCDRCGAPIFRYDGEAFCPQCQHAAQQAEAQQQASSGQADARAERTADQRPADAEPTARRSSDRRGSSSGGQQAPETHGQRRPRNVEERTREPQTNLPERTQGAPPGEAADALESSIAALARRAAAADDPRTAREYLEAAREAADALAALR